MSEPDDDRPSGWQGDYYKAALFDIVLMEVFNARESAAQAGRRQKSEVVWDVAEVYAAAAATAVAYRPDGSTWFDAAEMLRHLADAVEQNGLRELAWGRWGTVDLRDVHGSAAEQRARVYGKRGDGKAPDEVEAERRAEIATAFRRFQSFSGLKWKNRQSLAELALALAAVEACAVNIDLAAAYDVVSAAYESVCRDGSPKGP